MALSLAVGDRLETKYLLSGRVKVRGFDVDLVNPGPAPAPIFNDVVTKLAYDVAELTIGNYIIAKDNGVPLVAIPVFPNIFFPLTGLTVNTQSGIQGPKDLAGKKVGVPLGFASNPANWLRGLLQHQYGVSPDSVVWVEGDADSLRGIPYPRPERYRIEKRSHLEQLLETGEIDALAVAGGGATLSDNVRLITDRPYEELQAYYERSGGVLPINTLIVLKEETVARHPGLVDALREAFDEAHAIYDREEPDDAVHQGLSVGKLREMGLFPRPHGLEVHGVSVTAIADYLFEQGLTRTHWTLQTLFV